MSDKTLTELALEANVSPSKGSWFDKLPPEQQEEVKEFRRTAIRLHWSRAQARAFLIQHGVPVSKTTFGDWWRSEAQNDAS